MKTGISSNFLWRLFERCCAQLVTLAVSVILARILDPGVYGIVAIVTVFTTLMQTFIDSGLGNALIQKKDADSRDFSSVFYFNLILCGILYIFMWMLAPVVASLYRNESLVLMIRVLSLLIIISGFKNIQQAYVSRNMLFKKFFYATIAGTVVAAFVGIYLAYNGAGAWALIIQQLTNNFIDMVILWFVVKWRPTREFSVKSLKALLIYGWKLTAGDFIGKLYDEFRTLVIGKKYTSEDLAFFSKGKLFPGLLITNINASMDSVLFPAMSNTQDNQAQVKTLLKKALKTSTFFLFPMLVSVLFGFGCDSRIGKKMGRVCAISTNVLYNITFSSIPYV